MIYGSRYLRVPFLSSLRFANCQFIQVYDRKHTQTDIPANVTVVVRDISHEAVINSGSIRIADITDEDFIRVWNFKVSGFHLFWVSFFILFHRDTVWIEACWTSSSPN